MSPQINKTVEMLRIFILGAHKSIDGSSKDFDRLSMVEKWLISLGYDAFLAVHRSKIDHVDISKSLPRSKTMALAQYADLNLFLFTKTGVRNGLVGELTELQTRFPELGWKHVVLVEKDLTMSWILDQSKGGVLSIGPIKQIPFDDDDDLKMVTRQIAFNYDRARKDRVMP